MIIKNKLLLPKPKRKKTGKKQATKAERDYMDRVRKLGCIVMGKCVDSKFYLTIHHVRINNEKRNHYKIIPLLDFLHLIQIGNKDSIEWSKKGWEKRHGTQEELLIKVYERLLKNGGLPAPAMKIYEELVQTK